MSCWYTWTRGLGGGGHPMLAIIDGGLKNALDTWIIPYASLPTWLPFFCVYWLSNKYRQVVVKTVWKVLSLLNNVGYITDRVCFVTQCLTNPSWSNSFLFYTKYLSITRLGLQCQTPVKVKPLSKENLHSKIMLLFLFFLWHGSLGPLTP